MKQVLDQIAERAGEHMRRERVGEVFFVSLQKGMWLLPAGAALVLFFRAANTPISALASIGLAVLPYALWVALETAEALFGRVSRAAALGRVDRELDLHDRLRTADEFLRHEKPGGFELAAIEDAAARLEAARTATLSDRGRRPEPRGPVPATTAFLLLLAALMLTPALMIPVGEDRVEIAQLDEETARRSESKAVRERPVTPRAEAPKQGEPPVGAAQQKESSEQAGSRDKTRRGSAATGRTARTGGSGAQARSADASGAPSAAGQASTQKLKSKPRESKARKKKKPKSKGAPPRTPPRRDSGATSGSAKSSGSSKNPTVSAWKTQDTPPDHLEEPEADDEELDDESEDSESRGGMQPNLRSRKPPVNRDLGIGFGNRASKRANGRGGASPRKKSRGTASLVLGVPVPDHIKGQPNPGMTKVTRERGEPEREKAEPVQAGPRTKRNAPAGAVPRAELPPWMQELVRRYFLTEQES
ncbi:MAG: hypothetical protein ACYTHK_11140 [Planctomycetota bacterium]|jgi:hypothetical protein